MQISSTAFKQGDSIPSKFTCQGADVSPALAWSDPPAGVKSFALISDDPDAPAGTWVHWVAWDIPSSSKGLPENVEKTHQLKDGTRQGTSDFRRIGYGGPCPPSGTHRYYFKLYALNTMLDLSASTTKKDLETAMKGHILGQAELMGKYKKT
ncbi:MAG: YbhB/YbcL family Raf kinase inhibitor-like protein [Nitrospirae bacterium]|nr:YbhB/YbcL family Raf kinase inhibitor-like protein [Nitrospirota bacterium]